MVLRRALLVLLVTAFAAPARADTPRDAQLLIGVERVVGAHHYVVDASPFELPASIVTKHVGDDVFALWSAGQNPMMASLMAPRLAIDWTRRGFTFGASAFVWYVHSVGHYFSDEELGYYIRTEADNTVLGIAPRIGYMFCNDRGTCFWPRFGFSVATVRTVQRTLSASKGINPTDESTERFSHGIITADIEPTLVFALTDRVSFTMTFAINRVVGPPDAWVAGVSLGAFLSR